MLPLKCKIQLPTDTEPGRFGAVRKHDVHTGIDLYCKDGEPVYAIEDGVIKNHGRFTGASLGFPWWNETDCICIQGDYGIILYGELTINTRIFRDKNTVKEGELLGWIKQVLKVDKGRPMSMLHIELYNKNYIDKWVEWTLGQDRPVGLEDITPVLELEIEKRKINKILNAVIVIVAIIDLLILFG